MSAVPAAALSIALAALLALSSHVGEPLVVAVVVLIQVLVALAPAPADERGRIVRAPRFEAAILAGLVATVFTVWPRLLVGADGSKAGEIGLVGAGTYAALVLASSAGMVVTFISQMLRKDGRRALVTSTGYAVALAVFAALPIGWLTAVRSPQGVDVVTVCAAAIGAAMLPWMLTSYRLPGPWACAALGILAGAAVGALVAGVSSSSLTVYFGLVVGFGAAAFGILGQVLGAAWGMGRRHAAAGWGLPGALALVVASPLVHVAGLLSSSL